MADDPYQILGVQRTASADDIRAAYRKLARKLHPDLNPGDKAAEERFKQVAGAHDLLGDAEKRARFDRGEIDASGAERAAQPPPRSGSYGPAAGEYADYSGFADIAGNDDLLAELLARFGQRGGAPGAAGLGIPGATLRARLKMPFLDAVLGSTQQVGLPDGGRIELKVPPGTSSGDVLRLAGKGGAGIGGGPPGDLLITIEVTPHPRFRREQDDIVFELPVALHEAVLGARVEVEAPGGTVRLAVPAGSNHGTILRLRGRGVPRADGSRGDALAKLVLALPPEPDPALKSFLETWPGRAFDPRATARTDA
jgi:DnaJ-class molecular chaperone